MPVVAWFLVASALCACAARPVTPAPALDERTVRTKAEREETVLLERSTRLDDPALADYLAQIVERLAPPATRPPGQPRPRVVVLRDPTLTAFAVSDGLVVVHVGLLSRLSSEDELALILARELVHMGEGHARQRGANSQDTSCAASRTSRSRTATVILSRRLQEMKLASMIGYGRDLERATDVAALDRVGAAGFEPTGAAGAFTRLRGALGADGATEPFLLGCPAWLDERAASLQELLVSRGAVALRGPVAISDEFAQHVRLAMRESALLDAQGGRFDAARRQLDRVLAAKPDDAIAYLYEGDLQRLQAQAALPTGVRAQLLQKARGASSGQPPSIPRRRAVPSARPPLLPGGGFAAARSIREVSVSGPRRRRRSSRPGVRDRAAALTSAPAEAGLQHLAGGALRQLGDDRDLPRILEGGEPLAAVRRQLVRLGALRPGAAPRRPRLPRPARVGTPTTAASRHGRMGEQHRLDLRREHRVAARAGCARACGPSIVTSPSADTRARSPVRNQPSTSTARVSSGAPR